MTTPIHPPGVEPPYPPGVEPPYPPDIEPKSKDRRFIPEKRYARRNVILGLAVIFGAVVVLGLAFWFSRNSGLWTTASNTTTTATQNPPIPQPAPGTEQPPPTKP